MFRTVEDVPQGFDEDFLDWFRQRSETTWEALPARTPEETLAEFVKARVGGSAWQPGTRWLGGMGDAEIAEAERRWSLTFPPDYHFFLQRLHSVDRPMLRAGYLDPIPGMLPLTPPGTLAIAQVEEDDYMGLRPDASFYNWQTDTEALEERFAWLWEGLQFDVEYNDLWLTSWGPKAATLEAQKRRVCELVKAAPRLIPIFGHRYLLAEPCAADNPVLSIYQSDIIVYGANLRDYLLVEFGQGLLGLDEKQAEDIKLNVRKRLNERFQDYLTIPFWGEFLGI